MAKKRPQKKPSQAIAPRTKRPAPGPAGDRLLGDIRTLIDEARAQVARTVNSAMVALYWQIGKRIREDVLHEKRAEYGEEIVAALSRQLEAEYGRGFSHSSLTRMMKLAEFFPDERIVASLMQQLSWTHFLQLVPLDDPLKRDFYAEMCRLERWSVRMLRKKIDGMLFERTALSKKPDKSCTTPSVWPASGLPGRQRRSVVRCPWSVGPSRRKPDTPPRATDHGQLTTDHGQLP
jgi:hypothetical protein